MGMMDYRYALEFREVLAGLVRDEVERQRPRYQMATVQTIDRTTRRCTVRFPGDTTDATVSMGSIQPAAPGQVVRVEGLAGDRFIADVMGPAYQEPIRNDSMTFNGAIDINGAFRADGTALFTGDTTFSRGIDLPGEFSTDGFSGQAWEELKFSLRASHKSIGGGIRSVTSTGIAWSDRFLMMGLGRDVDTAPAGYFDVYQPPDTTVIPGYGGASNTTVTGGEVPLNAWHALYYEPPFSASSATVNTNFRLVNYTTAYQVPGHWVMIALRHSEGHVLWVDNRIQDYWRSPSFLNGWTHYGAPYQNVAYKRENGIVRLRGLADNGTFSQTSTGNMFILPAGYRPANQLLFPGISANAIGRVDVYADGSVRAMVGSTWTSLNHISFYAEQ